MFQENGRGCFGWAYETSVPGLELAQLVQKDQPEKEGVEFTFNAIRHFLNLI